MKDRGATRRRHRRPSAHLVPRAEGSNPGGSNRKPLTLPVPEPSLMTRASGRSPPPPTHTRASTRTDFCHCYD
eukprot:11001203-Alexandrium_andersonii.AAC.1